MEPETDTQPARSTTAAGIGALTSLPVMGLSFLAERLAEFPFIPYEIFDWLARVLPGDVLTAGIDFLVTVIGAARLGPTSEVAKTWERGLAIALVILLGAGFGFLLGRLGRNRQDALIGYGIRSGTLLAAFLIFVSASLGFEARRAVASIVWLGVLVVGWGGFLGWLIRLAGPALAAKPEAALSRRGFVTVVGGSAIGISLGAWGLGSLLSRERAESRLAVSEISAESPESPGDIPTPEEPAERIEPAPGTRPELTSNQDFYRIDINTRDPRIDAETWRLEVGGLVELPLRLSLAEIRAMPAITQTITLSCISNRLGGDLIGTSHWTGVRVKDVLELARVRPEGKQLFIESTDGFYESVAMADLLDERTLLVYAMNGLPLPDEHGFPLRIYIPNRYGMKQPKWIERMEVIDHEGRGYWVERGWSAQALVRTTSVIDTVAQEALTDGGRLVPVGGIAYAGARGISKVEVQVDGGTWVEAQLRAPPLSPLTWVQWRFDWPHLPGRHTFGVRAYDGDGALQILSPSGVRPDGATGVHEITMSFE